MTATSHPDPSAGARFEVRLADHSVTAYITESAWRARFGEGCSDSAFSETVRGHRELLDAAVARRVAAGSREPVVLRSTDL